MPLRVNYLPSNVPLVGVGWWFLRGFFLFEFPINELNLEVRQGKPSY